MHYKISNLTLCNMIWKSNSDETNSKIDEIVEYIKTTNSYINYQLLQIKSRLLNNFLPCSSTVSQEVETSYAK